MKNENEIVSKIKAEFAAFEEKKKTLIENLRTQFPSLFSEIFAQTPELKSVGWTQYTPYFNDGDECVFSVHCDDLIVNGDSENECLSIHCYVDKLESEEDVEINKQVSKLAGYSWYETNKIGQRGLKFNPDYNESLAKSSRMISDILNDIPRDFFKDLFGDHAEITLFSDGRIEVVEYDHD
jgi:hypothetical protein